MTQGGGPDSSLGQLGRPLLGTCLRPAENQFGDFPHGLFFRMAVSWGGQLHEGATSFSRTDGPF